ncbi:MAG: hypothetical protein J6Y28_05630 [Acholeplasmatales bacterium]|nr:hypothetical protein [Acholeplasmatales bacterium]
MSKGIRYLSGILALAATFMLCSCQPGGKTTKATTKGSDVTTSSKTTTSKQTTQKQTTTKRTTTKGTTTRRTTTERKTTTERITTQAITTQQQIDNGKVVNVLLWNDEFQQRVRNYYRDNGEEIEVLSPNIYLLPDGTKIKWTMVANEGSAYQNALDDSLKDGDVDIFAFEPDYSYKYINGAYSSYVASMADINLDQSQQYQYIKDVLKDKNGVSKGTSWQVCPGMYAVNMNAVSDVFGDSFATVATMKDRLSSESKFSGLGIDMEMFDARYSLLVGPGELFYYHLCQIGSEMYDRTTKTITVDEALFRYADMALEYAQEGFLQGTGNEYYSWSTKWNEADLANSKVIAKFCPIWYADWVLPTTCEAKYDDDGDLIASSAPWRLVSGFDNSFWGGTCLGITEVGIEDDVKKASIASILTKMTADKTTMRALSDGERDLTNNMSAMQEKAEDTTVSDPFYGGQNTFAVSHEAALAANAPVYCNYYLDIVENFQRSFMDYISQSGTASSCWADFISNLKHVNSELTIQADPNVIIDNYITFKSEIK